MSANRDDRPMVTAFAARGERAAVAYAFDWRRRGPSGEARQAVILHTADRGVSWRELPLTRTVVSLFRYWGFPVWPPERIAEVVLHEAVIEVAFCDEEVVFEPGGEAAWRATRAAGGLWTVRRIRALKYDGVDDPIVPPAIELSLPEGFAQPDPALLARIAERVADDAPFELPGWSGWAAGLLAGLSPFIGGPSLVVPAAIAALVGLGVLSILLERRRVRRRSNPPADSPRAAP